MSGFVIGKLIFTHGELQWKKCEEIKGYLFILLFLWSKDVKKILFWKGGVAPMAKGYSHITSDTRVMIEKLYKKVRRDDLADVLGITSQSLYRELRRCPPKCYTAEEAEAHAKRRSEEGQQARRKAIRKRTQEYHLVRGIFGVNPEADLEKLSQITNIPEERMKEYVNRLQKERKGGKRA